MLINIFVHVNVDEVYQKTATSSDRRATVQIPEKESSHIKLNEENRGEEYSTLLNFMIFYMQLYRRRFYC